VSYILAFVQFIGFGLGLAAFVYGLATNLNGTCVASGINDCVVVRITLAFDTLSWYGLDSLLVDCRLLFLVGIILILWEMVRTNKPTAAVV